MDDKKVPLQITLLGETFEILGDLDPVYANEIIQYVDNQMNRITKTSSNILSSSTKSKVALLACLNLADELFKERRHWIEKTKELTQILEGALKERISKTKEKIPKEA